MHVDGDWACPHCGVEFELEPGDDPADWLTVDDHADGSCRECPQCKGTYQLRCTGASLRFDTRPYREDRP